MCKLTWLPLLRVSSTAAFIILSLVPWHSPYGHIKSRTVMKSCSVGLSVTSLHWSWHSTDFPFSSFADVLPFTIFCFPMPLTLVYAAVFLTDPNNAVIAHLCCSERPPRHFPTLLFTRCSSPCKSFKYSVSFSAPCCNKMIIYVITARVRSTREGNIYTWKCLSVHFLEGGVPCLRFSGGGGGSQVSDLLGGGVPGLRFSGGEVSGLRFFGGGPRFWGGVPGLSKGKNFWHQIWLDTCSDQKKIFCSGTPPPPLVKGKIFDTRFGLIHVQTGKKFFVEGPPSLPSGIARNCYGYAAGGMPLEFTQEDFLVYPICLNSPITLSRIK